MHDQPEASLTAAQKESLNGRVLLLFICIALSTLRIGIWISNWIVLFWVYGRERVFREHLEIVKIKPLLVVSNGDVFGPLGFVHFLIAVILWMVLSISLLTFSWKLLPTPYHDSIKQGTYAGWSILAAITLFFTLNILPLKFALALALLVVAMVFLTLRRVP